VQFLKVSVIRLGLMVLTLVRARQAVRQHAATV